MGNAETFQNLRWIIQDEVNLRAQADPAYKRLLLANPTQVFLDACRKHHPDFEFPEGFEINLWHENMGELSVIVPPPRT